MFVKSHSNKLSNSKYRRKYKERSNMLSVDVDLDIWDVGKMRLKREGKILLCKKKKIEKMHLKDNSKNDKIMLTKKKKKARKWNFEEELSMATDSIMFAEEEMHFGDITKEELSMATDFIMFPEEEILCVDITNQFSCKPIDDKKENPEDVMKRVRREIESFVKFCRRDGYKIIGFIDKGMSTKETNNKWESRRIEELNSGRKRNRLVNPRDVGGIFKSLGVDILYPIDCDCDDAIAAYAYLNHGGVLSNDGDFFRYYVEGDEEMRQPFKIYSGFQMNRNDGRFSLTEAEHPGKIKKKPRRS